MEGGRAIVRVEDRSQDLGLEKLLKGGMGNGMLASMKELALRATPYNDNNG